MNPIATPLKALLDRMASIDAEYPEVQDTDVRDQMHDAVLRSFVFRERGYEPPRQFGMFTPAGNSAVRQALADFLAAAAPLALSRGLGTPGARLNAFQDIRVVANNGERFDTYFGARDGL